MSTPIPPGEGERRAMRGYVPQYELAARLIYAAIAAGNLKWVGLADRSAGDFDDVVLGLSSRIVAYQVKSKRDPEAFSIRTLLLGAENLLGRLVASWKKFVAQHPGLPIDIAFATDDYPRTSDSSLETKINGTSSAAYVRVHNASAALWSSADWKKTEFWPFIQELKAATDLGDAEFFQFWKNVSFVVSGTSKGLGLGAATYFDQRKLQGLFGILPKLVADPHAKDRWTLEELLAELKWKDPFELHHDHVFPIDSLVQSNEVTERELQVALENITSGYISLVGPPGSGKSTLLQSGVLPTPRAVIMRYLAFVPDEGHGLGRAEAVHFLHDLVGQFKKQGLGQNTVTGEELPQLRQQLQKLMQEAARRFKAEDVRTIVLVDGLDHVPREERPEHSLLKELPLPISMPAGVMFVLGTQRLELADLPPTVADQAREDGRQINIAPLSRAAVYRLAALAEVPEGVSREQIYTKSGGHPLSVRYLIEGILKAETDAARGHWLANDGAFGSDVGAFYRRAWHDLKDSAEAQRALSYIALTESALDPIGLDTLVGRAATDIAWKAASHLMKIDSNGRWAIFHNSFRLFLLEQTNLRFNRPDLATRQSRYRELAAIAKSATSDDPHRWLELRYLARAEDNASTLELAKAERFRTQFIEGRNAAAIHDDIRLAMKAAGSVRDISKFFDLILCRHEIEMRSDAIDVESLANAYIAVGNVDAAAGLHASGGLSFGASKQYAVLDALLQRARFEDARCLFDEIEPIDKLLGSEPIDAHTSDHSLYDWAYRAPIFREPRQILASIDRLRMSQTRFDPTDGLDDLKSDLRFMAARGEIEANPELTVGELSIRFEVDESNIPSLHVLVADLCRETDAPRALVSLEEAGSSVAVLSNDERRECARVALSLDRREVAMAFLAGLAPPQLRDDHANDDVRATNAQRVIFHSALERWVGMDPAQREYPSRNLLAVLQRHLEALGHLQGQARAGQYIPADQLAFQIKPILVFLRSADGKHGFERWEVDRIVDVVASAIVRTGSLHGRDQAYAVIAEIDNMLADDPGRLGLPKFRRAFALAAYDVEHDTRRALRRLDRDFFLGGEHSPVEYVDQVAELAVALAKVGAAEEAKRLLLEMHGTALGISRPAGKDAQYEMWRDLFLRACVEDPARRSERVKFFARLLNGLSKTEGRSAAWRVAFDVLVEGARCDAPTAKSLLVQLQNEGSVSWSGGIAAVLKGMTSRNGKLVSAAVPVYGRLALPFVDDEKEDILPDLVESGIEASRVGIAEFAVEYIQVDAHGALRLSMLHRLDRSLKSIGLTPLSSDLIERWRDEPEIRSSVDDKNPYKHVYTVAELASALDGDSDGKHSYYARRAFERIAELTHYSEIKPLVGRSEFAGDRAVIAAAARSAIRAGQTTDARTYISQLREQAEREGSWGSYQSGAKFSLHKALIELEGGTARERALDAFMRDLASGREWLASLLPDLVDVFALFKPEPSWTAMWDILTEHLSQFRDYKFGDELQLCAVESDEALIVDILASALDFQTTELARQVRIACQELCEDATNTALVVALIERLREKGGDHALEAMRIAWDNRTAPEILSHFRATLDAWTSSSDLAVLQYVRHLAQLIDRTVDLPFRQLPPMYSLQFPPSDQDDKFETPAGFTSSTAGLWTDDPFSWTWPLKRPLGILRDATSLDIGVLRRRVAEAMRKNGGRALFGPEAIQAHQAKFRRLEMLVIYRRVPVIAAFVAAREVATELLLAHQVDTRYLSLFLHYTGCPDLTLITQKPVARPIGIARPNIAYSYHSQETKDWMNAVREAPSWPREVDADWRTLASVASFQRTYIRTKMIEQHLFVPGQAEEEAVSLDAAMMQLPRVTTCEGILPLYEGVASGGIVAIDHDVASSTPDYAIMLCPRLGRELGLRPDPNSPLVFKDDTGHAIVRSVWWRDGGIIRHDRDSSPIYGEGMIVVANAPAQALLAPYLGPECSLSIWRGTSSDEEPEEGTVARATFVRTVH